jgi:hypothetical protein
MRRSRYCAERYSELCSRGDGSEGRSWRQAGRSSCAVCSRGCSAAEERDALVLWCTAGARAGSWSSGRAPSRAVRPAHADANERAERLLGCSPFARAEELKQRAAKRSCTGCSPGAPMQTGAVLVHGRCSCTVLEQRPNRTRLLGLPTGVLPGQAGRSEQAWRVRETDGRADSQAALRRSGAGPSVETQRDQRIDAHGAPSRQPASQGRHARQQQRDDREGGEVGGSARS